MNASNRSHHHIFLDYGVQPDTPIHEDIAFLVIELCLAGFGTILNIFVVVASLLSLNVRATPFMVSLGISDLIICTFTMTTNSLINAGDLTFNFNGTSVGNHLCSSMGAINVVVASSSSFTVLLIAIDRLLCVSCPLDFTLMVPQRRLVCIIVLIWAICFALGIVPIFVDGIPFIDIKEVGGRCKMEMDPIYQIVMVLVIIIIPCFAITIIYGRILHIFFDYSNRKKAASIANARPHKPEHDSTFSFQIEINKMSAMFSEKEEATIIPEPPQMPSVLSDFIKRIGRSNFTTSVTMTGIVVTFLLHWLPFGVVNIINASRQATIPYSIRRGLMWLLLMNSCWNPMIYSLSNPKIRSELARHLEECCCCFCRCIYGPSSVPVMSVPSLFQNESTSFMFPDLLRGRDTRLCYESSSHISSEL